MDLRTEACWKEFSTITVGFVYSITGYRTMATAKPHIEPEKERHGYGIHMKKMHRNRERIVQLFLN